MGWTDERVETLRKLWLDGLSASQIAKQLGGVTRNAVIGKVHRLGLSGRAAPSQPARQTFKAPRPARPAANAMPASRRAPPAAEVATAAAPAPTAQTETQCASTPQSAAQLAGSAHIAPPLGSSTVTALIRHEAPGAATVLTLGAHMCKWPIGDPSSDEFTFCGRRSEVEGPYCVEHARVAYQPQQMKKKSSTTELARSLRRYV
jgi:GcrA cell cycle regulator